MNTYTGKQSTDKPPGANDGPDNGMSKLNLGKTGDPATEEFLRTSTPVFLPG